MIKAFTRELTDTALRDEIELVADLVVAASDSTCRMSDAEIDAALGLSQRQRMSA